MTEVWKDIIGYEGLYQISNHGRVFSIKKEIFLKPNPTYRGYHLMPLSKDGKTKRILAHRLVAIAFIPNPLNLPQVNHKNGIKSDNSMKNLEWMTAKENTMHAHNNGWRKYPGPTISLKGSQLKTAKLTELEVTEIKKHFINADRSTIKKLTKIYPVTGRTLRGIRQGATWKHVAILVGIILFLSSCGPTWKLRRADKLIKQAIAQGAIIKMDTVFQEIHDTIPSIRIDTVLNSRPQIDTVRLEGGLQIVIKRDTVRKVERIQVSGPSIVRTIRIPYMVTKTISAPPDNRVKAWWRTVALVCGGLLALLLVVIVYRIIK